MALKEHRVIYTKKGDNRHNVAIVVAHNKKQAIVIVKKIRNNFQKCLAVYQP